MTPMETNDVLDAVAKVLLWCVLFGFLLLLIWLGAYLLAGNVIYWLHGAMFSLTKHDLDVIHYCGIALLKLWMLVFFLFPWAAIRLVLRKRRQ